MRIGVLGPVAAWTATGADVAPAGVRLRGLLSRLALAPGRTVTAETLVDDLWGPDPGSAPASANALQALVSRLRRALGPDLVATVPGGYLLDANPDEVDAGLATRRLAEAQHEPDPIVARELLGEALALWRGPALADVRRLPFASPAATRLDEQRAGAVERAAALDLRLGRPAASAEPVAALLAEQPLRESAATALARLLHATGRQADALAVLDAMRARLADELGVDPGGELQEARLDVLRGTTVPVTPPRPRTPAPATPLTSFVGRDADVARLRELLGDSRLVTLVGPGGAGKTRLARETVADREAAVAELAPLGGAEQLPAAVLAAVGSAELVIRPEEQVGGVERVVAAVGRRELTLVLDNCEHVIDAAATLAEELLARCPGLRVLATSREPLGVPGEQLHPVEALAEPAAARLFADRAAAVAPGFDPAEHAAAVAEICARLDGQPLPIELAAARLRTLSPDEILTRLDDRFRLLTTGSRTAAARHQTLRAVVDWSWELLAEPERTVARRLSVFAGGATADAAEQVVGEGVEDVFTELAALVDKSLVVAVAQPGGPTRYRMLETIREYAGERLAESGETAAIARAHAAWVVALVERAEPQLRRAEQLRWIAVLRAEAGNITAALRRATAELDAATAYRLVGGMFWAWQVRGQNEESRTWVRAVAELPEPELPEPLARVTAFLAIDAASRGELVAAQAYADLASARAAAVPPPRHPVLDLLDPVAVIFTEEDDAPLAALAETHPDPWVRAFALQVRGAFAENTGEIGRQREHIRAAHALFAELGDRFGLGLTLGSLAELESLGGHLDAAVAACEEAIALVTELGGDDDLPHYLQLRATLAVRSGDLPLARKVLTEALTVTTKLASEHADSLSVTQADLDRREGDLDGARRRLAEIDPTRGGGLAVPHRLAYRAVLQALVELDAGDLAAARGFLAEAVDPARESRDGPIVALVAEAAARYRLACGDPAGAARLLGVAQSRRGTVDLGDPDLVGTLQALDSALGPRAAELREETARLPQEAGLDLLRERLTSGAGTA